MEHIISTADGEISFPCEGEETLLDAAERAGYAMPYSCRKGVCASCEGGLIAGRVRLLRSGREFEGPTSRVKFCQARPCEDITIAPASIADRTPPARRRMAATIHRIDRPVDDVTIVHLRFPIGRRVPFMAGQYVKLHLEGGETRNYSLANPPRDNDCVQLHVRRHDKGFFSEGLLPRLTAGDRLDVEMPFGLFTLTDNDDAPAILLATGTGFAPVRSMIEDLLRREVKRRITLYWGARRMEDFYDIVSPRRWDERYAWFTFVPVLSQDGPVEGARTGYVQDAVLEDYPDLTGCEVYACGNADMIEAARARLTGDGGLREEDFHADIFVPADLDDAGQDGAGDENSGEEERELRALG